jgi:Na+/H+ antiporter NhaD/arsenite permease-like protein
MNPLIMDLARKAGYHISFWQFFKLGFPVMVGSMVLSAVYLWLVFLR